MTTAGWIIMVLSIGSVLTLLAYCLTKVFSLPPVEAEEHLHGPFEMDTPDAFDPD